MHPLHRLPLLIGTAGLARVSKPTALEPTWPAIRAAGELGIAVVAVGSCRCRASARGAALGMRSEITAADAGAGDGDGSGVVAQMWEGVARMTALARDTTQSFFLDASALHTGAPAASPPGAASLC